MSSDYAEQGMDYGDWMLNSNCNKYAEMCSPTDFDFAYSLSTHWFTLCRDDKTLTPKKLALKKCPHLFDPEYQKRIKKLKFRRGF